MKDKLITVIGPTAVGKTDLTLRLAEYYGSEVISGDAYQVYRGMNVGTAKPDTHELKRVKHHLIDILNPGDAYSVSLFQEQVRTIIKELNQRLKIPILSGGTGLYVQSLLENYDFNTIRPNRELRKKLDLLYDDTGIDGLHSYADTLAAKDGLVLTLTDKHRLYRAIELMEAGDYESLRHPKKDGLSYDGPVIGLQRDREVLYERINRRVELMFDLGLVDEVKMLIENGADPLSQAFKGIGYKEVVAYLEGDISLDECKTLIQKHTRHFAKRQITWYKRMPYIQWITVEDGMSDTDIFDTAKQIIEHTLHIQ